MGKAILYCFKCSSLLREDDFAKGKAVRVGDHVACAGCAPEAPAAPPDPLPKRHITSNRIPAARPGSSQAIRRPPDAAPAGRKTALIAGSAAAVLLLGVVVAMMSSSPKPADSPAPPPPPPEQAVRRPAAGSPDRKALDSARAWARSNPQDLLGQLREFQNVAFDHDRTPAAAEAQKEIARIRAEIRGYVDAALSILEREIKAPMDRREYRSALTIVESAGKRLPYPDWELARSKREHQIRDLLRNEPAPPPPRPVDPDLAGHWAFDEGSGVEAQDLSGHGHTARLIGAVSWVPGRFRSAVRFDGSGAHVVLPNSPLLDGLQKESYSLAAWFKPETLPAGPPDSNDSAHGIVIKRGWHEGLLINPEGKFLMDHWLDSKSKVGGGTWSEGHAAGKFHHLAGVVNRSLGKSQIYVDGRLKNTGDWAPGTASLEFGSEPWRIGIGAPGAEQWAWPAKGVIDEVRMYTRALTAEEVQSLYETTR